MGAIAESDFSAILDTINRWGATYAGTVYHGGFAWASMSGGFGIRTEALRDEAETEEGRRGPSYWPWRKLRHTLIHHHSSTAAASKGRLVKLNLVVSQKAEQEVSIGSLDD